MSRLVGWIDKRFYPGWGDNWDDGLFRKAILAHLQPEHIVLDLGAGAGIAPHMNFRGIAAEVCGVDPDPRVLDNHFLDEGIVGSGEAVPYPDSHFDIVFANNVLEHVADPDRVFKEVHRVLKPGGWFLAKTPNRYHYVSLIGRITPHWFHTLIARQRGRSSSDTFPTLYRVNDRRTIILYGQRNGFRPHRIDLIEGRPEYMRITSLSYAIGLLYERIVNSASLLKPLRVILIAQLQKY